MILLVLRNGHLKIKYENVFNTENKMVDNMTSGNTTLFSVKSQTLKQSNDNDEYLLQIENKKIKNNNKNMHRFYRFFSTDHTQIQKWKQKHKNNDSYFKINNLPSKTEQRQVKQLITISWNNMTSCYTCTCWVKCLFT